MKQETRKSRKDPSQALDEAETGVKDWQDSTLARAVTESWKKQEKSRILENL